MEIRWLEDFLALARTRHFSRAAEEQNVTQPTFSRRIKLLEEEMGTTLINRQTLPLSLTPAGEAFLGMCHDVTRRVDQTRQRLAQMAEEQAGQLRLGAPQSLLAQFLPQWLQHWREPPPIQPYLRATAWLVGDYFQGLASGEIDLALCYWPTTGSPLELANEDTDYCVIGRERFIPVSLADDRGQPRFALGGGNDAGKGIGKESGKGRSLPLIAYHPRGMIDAAIRAHLDRLGDSPTLTVLNESIQSGNIRELVSLGYGLGWLPERSLSQALASGELVPAGDERWVVSFDIRLYRHLTTRRAAVDTAWQVLRARALVP
ncbi:LysR family transcriptional regulator [Halomonas denitrificans]|uniref:LysR family transcriptional regulator n=1 Tax=Halomonas TaxID=2745 RepID=UPI001A8E07C3|nr:MULTISPECIES: LysR family transcriptional regulator [Halomonas]MED5294034.1 LysR family transcriptional regulator [Pseudomonadota bacterium]MBN8411234.1 LysR family transcriptional regulator [Halomonas litopenaei]MBY5925856.1 LysR family transcriptional regulator [Halomonas sp. DP4Y7-2]MBY5927588.1 LysR family transcriptional regulator [Halomonas sp. DP8Y7-3]MBY5969676.1 LysR family transcriptional regulator [Halomonas denitrificans]